MFDRLRQSLAFRLAIQYAVVFALTAAVLFSVLYFVLADALDQREKAALERRADDFAAAFERTGAPGLASRASADIAGVFYVRLITPDKTAVFVKVPPDWFETETQNFPVPFGVLSRQVRTFRVPQNAEHDYTVVTRELSGGWFLQVGQLLDSPAIFLAPLRRAFAVAGASALILSIGLGTLLAWRATRPLREVTRTTRRIVDTGDFAARVPGPGGNDELAVLVRQLNTLLD